MAARAVFAMGLALALMMPFARPAAAAVDRAPLPTAGGSPAVTASFFMFEKVRQQAEQGYRGAAFNLGLMHLGGIGTPADRDAARRLFEAAAAQGLPSAMGQLGALSQAEDPPAALRWYRAGAERGDRTSLFGLGLMYQAGTGVQANQAEAAKWFRMAAERGHSRARFILGALYYQGRGVPRDPVEAYVWFALAGAALPPGSVRERAIAVAAEIETMLTADQIEAARQRAQAWESEQP